MTTLYPDHQGEDRTEGDSLDAQRTEIQRYCEQHGYEPTRLYADEGGSVPADEISKHPELTAK